MTRRAVSTRPCMAINAESKIFSPANMRAGQEVTGYKTLLDYYIDSKYTLRYTGRGLHSSTSQLNLGRSCHGAPPLSPPDTP